MRFADDHFIPSLRGEKRIAPAAVRKRLASRAAWLEETIQEREPMGLPVSLYLEELAAIAQAVEAFDARHPVTEVTVLRRLG